LEWSDSGVEGAFKFLKRLWKMVAQHVSQSDQQSQINQDNLNKEQKKIRRQIHETIAKVSDDIGRRYTFNTAIASVMTLINALAKFDDRSPTGKAIMQEALEAIVKLLSPIVPHISHQLWQDLGYQGAVVDQPWSKVDSSALVKDEIQMVIQINGKLRSKIVVSASDDKSSIEKMALEDEKIIKFIEGKTIKKVIVVPKKLVSIVV
ncbi:MAG: class I tRNA ligase family protein, partial [Methylococcales bacterium]|nr:class I tRNA ligase family protein [Methylococcales bacterium]